MLKAFSLPPTPQALWKFIAPEGLLSHKWEFSQIMKIEGFEET